MDTHMLFLN